MARPAGKLNLAARFVPLALPELPANPAMVLTIQSDPIGVSFRIV